MFVEHFVDGYQDFSKFILKFNNQDSKPVNILFTGKKLPNGESWCVDCNVADAGIKMALERFGGDSHFIHVDVGDRPTWKDMNNNFRKDPRTHLLVIPTLIRWKGPQRLEGNQLLSGELLQMFFQDDD